MRTGERVAVILLAVEFIIAACSFLVLPDTIARHWGIGGTSYGSRFYVFGPPLLAGAVTAASIMISRWYGKRNPVEGESAYYVLLYVSFMMILIGFIGTIMMLAASLRSRYE